MGAEPALHALTQEFVRGLVGAASWLPKERESRAWQRLVVDDCLCPNKIISHQSQLSVYDRLNIEPLWNLAEYTETITSAGFRIAVSEDISIHCERSYEWLAKSARKLGQEKLSRDYEGTVEALRKADLAWHIFVATRDDSNHSPTKGRSMLEGGFQ